MGTRDLGSLKRDGDKMKDNKRPPLKEDWQSTVVFLLIALCATLVYALLPHVWEILCGLR